MNECAPDRRSRDLQQRCHARHCIALTMPVIFTMHLCSSRSILILSVFLHTPYVGHGSTPSRTRRLLRSSSRCLAPRPPSTFGIRPSRNPTASASPSSGSSPAPSTAPTSTASKQDGRSGTRQLILPFVKFLLFYWIYYTLSFLLYIPSY